MSGGSHRAAGGIAVAMLLAICATVAAAQQQPPGAAQPAVPPQAASPAPGPNVDTNGKPVTLDTVVAIVNGDLILESDVDAERRFAAFEPFSAPKQMTDEGLIERLIDRTLIVQQMALQEGPPVTAAQVDDQLNALRKAIPKCAAYHCETEAGWQKFVEDQGFTMEELHDRWKQRMEVLQFIEERFRNGILISPSEIDAYYKTTMLPGYAKENAPPPPEASIADKIQEILLQQQVDKLLDDWLNSLRAEGSVKILKPGEEAP